MFCPYCWSEFDTLKDVKIHCREYCLDNSEYDFTKISEDINRINLEEILEEQVEKGDFSDMINSINKNANSSK